MNTSLNSLSIGARNLLRFKRMWFLLWLLNFVFALVLTAPLAALLSSSLGHSKLGSELLGSLDVQWIAEFLYGSHGYPSTQALPGIALLIIASLPLAVFLAGGALWLLVNQATKYSPQRFFEGCGKFFWRFLRLFLISLLFYGLVLILNRFLVSIADQIWGEGIVETPLVYFGWVRRLIVLLLLLFVNMVFDYAKIRVVAEDIRGSFRAAFWSLRFCWRNLRATFGPFCAVAAIGLLFLILYLGLSQLTGRTSMPAIVAVFVIMQLYVLSRVWLRLEFWSSETEIYRALLPAPVAPEEPAFVAAGPEPELPVIEPEAPVEPQAEPPLEEGRGE
jgi:hypothetical protein